MSEQGMRLLLVKRLVRLHAKPIENKAGVGTPDVNYVHGWMELKWDREWPPRGGPFRIPHFTRKQRLWLKARWAAQGLAFLVVQVGQNWLAFAGCDVDLVGLLPKEQLYAIALWHSTPFDLASFQELITRSWQALQDRRTDNGICKTLHQLKSSYSNGAVSAERNTKRQPPTLSAIAHTSAGNAKERFLKR